MRYALFMGCTIPARLNQYELSARAVLSKLGVELVDIRDFNCCGYPMRNYDYNSFMFSSARNIALAQKKGLDIITLCKCCFGSLRKAKHVLENSSENKEVHDFLKKEKLTLHGKTEIKHFLSVLFNDMGLEKIRENITKPFNDLKIATHYGCHALRPKDIVDFDDPDNPVIFDELVNVTGAQSVNWQSKLECCGAPLLGINDELSENITEKKLSHGIESGADFLCTACPYCQLQFDSVQNMMISEKKIKKSLSPILYTQLLGLSMGIDADTLQLSMNELDISGIKDYI
ncbi:CoB--CoM heterodisulfide reductase iron-sulfur subunit B family protein [Spirochaetota bacterium]